MSTTEAWLKLNFASCVIRQTRSSGVLVLLCFICNIITFVNYTYDMVADNQFHMFYSMYGGPFARVLYLFLIKEVGETDDNVNAMFQSYLSKLIKRETG